VDGLDDGSEAAGFGDGLVGAHFVRGGEGWFCGWCDGGKVVGEVCVWVGGFVACFGVVAALLRVV
jgi:hypothetical protein